MSATPWLWPTEGPPRPPNLFLFFHLIFLLCYSADLQHLLCRSFWPNLHVLSRLQDVGHASIFRAGVSFSHIGLLPIVISQPLRAALFTPAPTVLTASPEICSAASTQNVLLTVRLGFFCFVFFQTFQANSEDVGESGAEWWCQRPAPAWGGAPEGGGRTLPPAFQVSYYSLVRTETWNRRKWRLQGKICCYMKKNCKKKKDVIKGGIQINSVFFVGYKTLTVLIEIFKGCDTQNALE